MNYTAFQIGFIKQAVQAGCDESLAVQLLKIAVFPISSVVKLQDPAKDYNQAFAKFPDFDTLEKVQQIDNQSIVDRNVSKMHLFGGHGGGGTDNYEVGSGKLIDALNRYTDPICSNDMLNIKACNLEKADIPAIIRRSPFSGVARRVYTPPGHVSGNGWNQATTHNMMTPRPWLFPDKKTFHGPNVEGDEAYSTSEIDPKIPTSVSLPIAALGAGGLAYYLWKKNKNKKEKEQKIALSAGKQQIV